MLGFVLAGLGNEITQVKTIQNMIMKEIISLQRILALILHYTDSSQEVVIIILL